MIRRIVVWLFWVGLPIATTNAQCALDTQIVLQEIDTARLLFEVENARVNDLADPTQGLCKVRIFFEHQFLGDLRIFLISPSGQQVQLVGNEGNFGLTQFTEWDVCFLPSTQAVVPDPSFSPTWSNNQVWGSFAGIYNGSYYPFQGDLEDFNIGPVNGVWTLLAYDRTIFYRGIIKGIELEFCENDGLICNTCDPGELSLELSQTDYCLEDTICLQLNQEFIPNDEDSLHYIYQNYIISPSGFVIDTGKSGKLIQYPTGSYSICGLMYYQGDTALIPSPGSNWTRFVQTLNQSTICAEPSECVSFVIHPSGDTVIHEVVLCQGDSFFIDNQVFMETGQHFINLKSNAGCDSIVDLRIQKVELNSQISVRDTLDCNTDSIWVYVDLLQVPPGADITWSSETNPQLDTSARDSLLVFQAGQIRFITSFEGCADTSVVQVFQDSVRPTVFLVGDTISCNQSSVLITSFTNANSPSYEWGGPNGPIPKDSSAIWVMTGGRYEVAITEANGCVTRSSIFIASDTSRPQLDIQYDSLVCLEDSIPIILTSDVPITNISWDGPNGRFVNFTQGFLFDHGWYRVTARGENGCETTDSIFLEKKLRPTSVQLASRPIQCLQTGALFLRSNVDSITPFQWQGPQGLLSNDSIFETSIPGKYFITYESPNGCAGIDSITVSDRRTYPNINIAVDFLACLGDSAWAVATSDSSISNVLWITPSGSSVMNDSVFLNRNGWYKVTVTNSQGCTSSDSVEINASNTPNIQLFADTINCLNDKMGRVFATADRANLIYNWFQGGRLFSADSNFTTNQGGLYILQSRSPTGCNQTDSISVIVDTLNPRIILTSPDTITCLNPIAEIRSFVNPMLAVYNWTGPNNYNSFMRNPQVDVPGVYQVIVMSINGCSDSSSIEVVGNVHKPDVILLADSITCHVDSAIITSLNNQPQWQWDWLFPDSMRSAAYPLSTKQGGKHEVIVTDTLNGCKDTAEILILADTGRINISIADTIIPCDIDSIVIRIPSQINFDQAIWNGPGGQLGAGRSLSITTEGNYILTLISKNGCRTDESFFVDKKDIRSILDFEVQSLTCIRDTAQLNVATKSNEIAGFWLSPAGQTFSSDTILTTVPGEFVWVSTSVDGCVDSFFQEVLLDTANPMIILQKSGDLICERTEIELNVSSDIPDNHQSIEWSSPSGASWTNGSSPNLIEVRETGDFQVCVTNIMNGCTACDVVAVSDTGQAELEWILDVIPPSCPGESDGMIHILSISGGEGPFTVLFNNLEYQTGKIWDFLRSGSYSLSLIDINGCRLDSIIVLETERFLTVNAGRDTTISPGDMINLDGHVINLAGIPGFFEWNTDSMSFGRNDLSPQVSPRITTAYRLIFIADSGCEIEDEVIVFVNDQPKVFVPNIFTPNGDQVNDQLEIGIGPGIQEVELFEIYDRWGELVYKAEGVIPDQNTISWDGTLDGQPLVPGVFIYRLLAASDSGVLHHLSGNITLVR